MEILAELYDEMEILAVLENELRMEILAVLENGPRVETLAVLENEQKMEILAVLENEIMESLVETASSFSCCLKKQIEKSTGVVGFEPM
jgi:DNA-binding transcriptional ArsR family regulator